MSSQNTPPPVRRNAPRPPRINIKNLHSNNGSAMGSVPPSAQPPFTAQTNYTMPGSVAGQPYWPQYANPFAAGNFMAKGFEDFVDFTKSGMSFGEKFTYGLYEKFSKWSKKWFTHIFLFIVVTLYTIGGASLFSAIETKAIKTRVSEQRVIQAVFYEELHNLTNDKEISKYYPAGFEGKIVQILRDHRETVKLIIFDDRTLEQQNADELAKWNFVNAMFFCGTIYTTIGYGHITPSTPLGRSLSIIYAIIGIPLFLILLADFGKLFTRGLKFMWAYVRRIYYTGTCRKMRKQQQLRDAMNGFNTVYDMAVRRPSHFFGMAPDTDVESQESADMAKSVGVSHPETPTSPYPETFEIDDEFNLPISVATFLLIGYILIGSLGYTILEDWDYFVSFYFVFVSMSTIGFGDYVPQKPVTMLCSIIYFIFGMALTSMFINVVQIKLSDTFKQASAKIGATIGLNVASEMGDDLGGSQIKTPSDIASVHGSRLGKIAEIEDESINAATPLSLTAPLPSILRPARPVSPPTPGSVYDEVSEYEVGPPPLLPRRQVSMEQPPEQPEKKKKKRLFK